MGQKVANLGAFEGFYEIVHTKNTEEEKDTKKIGTNQYF